MIIVTQLSVASALASGPNEESQSCPSRNTMLITHIFTHLSFVALVQIGLMRVPRMPENWSHFRG